MYLGKVIGSIVCTQKDPQLHGLKLLIVQRHSDQFQPVGNPFVAIDTVGQSGTGDFVYIAKSRESAFPLAKEMVPSDAGILGIIDDY
ncbi:MAG: EutN/CcmL family microcompartment protein [Bacillus sp. (in: Bacteria)]|nr:EutN/CcmL family microcompartment protein [Bacillus sp. (in: firmicutes)]